MAEKQFKINEPIEIVYQAPNRESGLSGGTAVVAEIFLPNDTKDSTFPDLELVEIGTSGVYKGLFTPDQEGEWKVVIHKSNGDGQVVKRYSVGAHNVNSVGAAIENVDSDVAVVQTTADSIETKVDDLDIKVSSLDTPPMVS